MIFMLEALKEAQKAFAANEVPIGAVVVRDGQIIARAHNAREQTKNPIHHAEIQVIEQSARIKGDWRLNDCALYVTLEPCPMCLGALFQARVGRLIVGCLDPKRQKQNLPAGRQVHIPSLSDLVQGANTPSLFSNNHELKVEFGVQEEKAARLLKDFFKKRRGIFS